MIITRADAFLFECTVTEPFRNSRMWVERRSSLLVRLETDSGLIGWGEVFGPAAANHGVAKAVGKTLIGRNPLMIEQIWERTYFAFREHIRSGSIIEALSGFDIALWDIKGKHFGVPVCELGGGALRHEVPAYASGGFRFRSGDAMERLRREVSGYVENGFKAVKMKIGLGVEADVAAVKAVREAIGPGIQLMVDANEAYDILTAKRVAREIQQFDIAWFEEPLPPDDIDGYLRLRDACDIPIAAGEAEFTRFGFKEIIRRQAVDILQPDVCGAGGLTECRKIADMAQAFGVRCVPHAWGTGVALAASLHLIATLPNAEMGMASDVLSLEYDLSENPIREALLDDALRPSGGIVKVPTGPGLGIEVNLDALAPFLVS
jgi:D-galactarolactone cycloisomerase